MVAILSWKPRRIEVVADNEEGGAIHLTRLYCPAWRAQNATIPINSPQTDGLIRCGVPCGPQHFLVLIDRGLAERLGLWTTLACALVWLRRLLAVGRVGLH
jgi:hypothetical protein